MQGLYLLGDVKEFINPQADQALSVTLLQKGGEEGIVFEDDVLRSLALREVESFVVLEETVTDVATRQKLRHLTVLGVAKIGDKEEVRYEKHLFYPAGDRSFIIKKDAAPPPTKPSRPVGGRAIV